VGDLCLRPQAFRYTETLTGMEREETGSHVEGEVMGEEEDTFLSLRGGETATLLNSNSKRDFSEEITRNLLVRFCKLKTRCSLVRFPARFLRTGTVKFLNSKLAAPW